MKSFSDLEFGSHAVGSGLHALTFFPNGYGVSVVRFRIGAGYGSYTSNDLEWELAILRGKKGMWEISYETPMGEGVMGHLSADEVSDVMKKVQELPPVEGIAE